VLFDEPLKKHTTFRIGGPCGVWVEPRSERDLREILKLAKAKNKKAYLIGKGSNLLARDSGLNGIVIHLGARLFKRVFFFGHKVTAGAGVRLSNLINFTCRNGLWGIEGLAGIPGTLGGAIFMNAGYNGNISDCLESVRVMDKKSGKIFVLKKRQLKFSYRHSSLDGYIILTATISFKKGNKEKLLEKKNELLRIKKAEQPLDSPNAGCIFKNPGGTGAPAAARYIDMLGFRGKQIGGARVSKKHANFIVNSKNAKASDVLRLIGMIRKRVKSKFGVEMATEIVML